VVIDPDWLKKKVNNLLIEPDWPNMLINKGENKVTSRKLTRYDFAAAYLDTSVLLFKLVKGKILLVRAVTAYLESIDVAPFVLNLDTRWR
jgi:hypothetical protein